MIPVCPICSEMLSSENVATACGHVFHLHCIDSWLSTSSNSRTCPTCRREQGASLIKLFFEVDDKANLDFEDILKVNDDLTSQVKSSEERAQKFETKFRELDVIHRRTLEIMKQKERQKELDDMAIVGLKSIKEDSIAEILQLQSQINNLKLDLLAERQLRRAHQTSLHELDPTNENYSKASISAFSNGNTKFPSIGSRVWSFNSEASPIIVKDMDQTATIPRKIVKVDKPAFNKTFDLLKNGHSLQKPIRNLQISSSDNACSSSSLAQLPTPSNVNTNFGSKLANGPSQVVRFGLPSSRPFSVDPNSSHGSLAFYQ